MLSIRHQSRKPLLGEQLTNNGDIKQHKSKSSHYGCIHDNKSSSSTSINNHRETVDSFIKFNGNYISIKSNNSHKMKEKLNIKWIGATFFAAASLFCLYYIWTVPSEPKPSKYFTTKLKLVSVFNRHGDRKLKFHLPFHQSAIYFQEALLTILNHFVNTTCHHYVNKTTGAPSDGLPKGDRHAEKVDLFWPNGLVYNAWTSSFGNIIGNVI